MGLRVSGTDPRWVDSWVSGCPDPQKRLFWTFGGPKMQNAQIFPNGFERHSVHFAKALFEHQIRTPQNGVPGCLNQWSAGFVVSGHVNLCLFLRSPPGMVLPDPSKWVLVSHAVDVPYPQKGSRTSPKGVNSRGAHFAFCANPFLFTWFQEYRPNIYLQTFAPPQICTVENQANWSTRAREGIYKGAGICSLYQDQGPRSDPPLRLDKPLFWVSRGSEMGPKWSNLGVPDPGSGVPDLRSTGPDLRSTGPDLRSTGPDLRI